MIKITTIYWSPNLQPLLWQEVYIKHILILIYIFFISRDTETDVQGTKCIQGHTVNKWQYWDLNTDCMDLLLISNCFFFLPPVLHPCLPLFLLSLPLFLIRVSSMLVIKERVYTVVLIKAVPRKYGFSVGCQEETV